MILHPFLGEMGLEVRGFLGQIEPWLRSGWLIPAKRPALHPEGTAFDDPEYFARLNEIKAEYGLSEMVGRVDRKATMPLSLAHGRIDDRYHLNLSAELDRDLVPVLSARRDLRRAFLDRYGHDRLIPTPWHTRLSSQSHADDELYMAARWATVPSYRPHLFVNPPFEFQAHIGVQLRNVPGNPGRNSDPVRMGRLADAVAAILGLPVLVYGKATDDTLPGRSRTLDLLESHPIPQLNAELVMLSRCALMISPDSGWADLMGWLRVPTLLERLQYPWGFEALRPFRPRLLLAEEGPGLADQIAAVRADDGRAILPDPDRGIETGADFLHPAGAECADFRRRFGGVDD